MLRPLAIVAAALGLLTTACSGEPARWHADARFTAEERAEIVRGVVWLSEVSGRDVGGVAFDYEVASPEALPLTIRRERPPHATATGYCTTTAGRGTVYLSPTTGHLAALAAHELAHCELGLADDPESEGIMRDLDPMRWTACEQVQCLASATCVGR